MMEYPHASSQCDRIKVPAYGIQSLYLREGCWFEIFQLHATMDYKNISANASDSLHSQQWHSFMFSNKGRKTFRRPFPSLTESFGSDEQTELSKLQAACFIRETRIKLNRQPSSVFMNESSYRRPVRMTTCADKTHNHVLIRLICLGIIFPFCRLCAEFRWTVSESPMPDFH